MRIRRNDVNAKDIISQQEISSLAQVRYPPR
jgi:hypothetical protein